MPTEIFDCHVHTEFSACAEDVSLAWYAKMAGDIPFSFAITDHSAHIFFPPHNRWGFWSDEAEELFKSCALEGTERCYHYLEVVGAQRRGNMFRGIELDIMPDGRPVFPEERLPDLDMILGSVHALRSVSEGLPQREVEAEFKFQVERFCDLGADVIAHPFRLLASSEYEVPTSLVEWLVETASEHGVALEINSHKVDRERDLVMGRLALEAKVDLAVGTDTHRSQEFGDFSYHRWIAEQLGVGMEVFLAAPVRSRPGGSE